MNGLRGRNGNGVGKGRQRGVHDQRWNSEFLWEKAYGRRKQEAASSHLLFVEEQHQRRCQKRQLLGKGLRKEEGEREELQRPKLAWLFERKTVTGLTKRWAPSQCRRYTCFFSAKM